MSTFSLVKRINHILPDNPLGDELSVYVSLDAFAYSTITTEGKTHIVLLPDCQKSREFSYWIRQFIKELHSLDEQAKKVFDAESRRIEAFLRTSETAE